VWFAGALKYNMPPDESYHYNFVNLYTQQPLSHGPFIGHEPQSYLFLGDIQQTPSFLYHYIMSFPLRLFNHVMSDMNHRVVALRLIDVGIGALSLLVLDRIFKKLKVGVFISNLALAFFVCTGMFVWISAAISYDSMSMLGWFLLLLCLLRLQEKISLQNIVLVALFSVLTIITKVTYAPVIVAVLLACLFINRARLDKFAKAFTLRSVSKGTVALIVVFVAVCGLALGRVGYNVVRYHAVSPSCQAVHGAVACSVSTAVQRDEQVHAAYAQFKRAGGHVAFNPLSFTGDWSDKMYQRMFFYLGHRSILPNTAAEAVLAAAAVFTGYLFVTKKTKLVETDKEALLVAALIFYVAALFLLNYHSYLTNGTGIGFQGRYLLPVMPIAYVFILKLTRQNYRRLPDVRKPLLMAACVVLLLAFLYEDFPALVFLKGTDVNWYSAPSAAANLKLKHAMMKSRVFQPDTLNTE
jgi:hypothetical protein